MTEPASGTSPVSEHGNNESEGLGSNAESRDEDSLVTYTGDEGFYDDDGLRDDDDYKEWAWGLTYEDEDDE